MSKTQERSPALDGVVQLCPTHSGSLLALTATGRIFERHLDARDFSSGPNHRARWLWREIPGPLDGPLEPD